MVRLSRDLSTCTADEVRARWDERARLAIDKIGRDSGLGDGYFERQLADHNPIFYLAERCWFDNDPTLIHPPLHRDRLCKALLDHYLDESKKFSGLIILLPRDSFKTTFTHGIFPMFIALRGKHVHGRDERIAIVHHKEDQASASLQRLRAKFVQHPWLKRVWPEFCAKDEWGQKTKFDWPCKASAVFHDPSVLAAGLGARLTGFHFDWIIFDDIVTEEHRESKAVRDDAFGKYQASRFMLDTRRGKELCSGTRYHIHDLWQKLLDARDDNRVNEERLLYKRLVAKAIADDDKGGKDVLLFPTRLTYQFLEQRRQEELSRSGNDTFWHLQYQLEPRSSNQIATDRAWLKFCRRDEVPGETWRVLTCDTAWKGQSNWGEGDYASIQVWAFERRGNLMFRYLLDGTHSNELTSLDGEREIFRLMAKYGVTDCAVEEHGGWAFRTQLQNGALQRGRYLNLIDLKMKTTQKQARIAVFLRDMQAGHIFLCEDGDQTLRAAFIEQFETFPQCIDELCDALDAAAFTSDPNVQEQYAPTFNSNAARKPWWVQEAEEPPRRTRYCGA